MAKLEMTKKHCNECNKETWHNPVKKIGDPPRCTSCGFPKRYGQKNFGLRIGGKIMMVAKP